MGHSMGGHGALILGLKEPDLFTSVSAFSPIINPSNCPWGEKAFEGYFGEDKEKQAPKFDTIELLKSGKRHKSTILIDQGLDDEFLHSQLSTQLFADTCDELGQPYKLRLREGYDHSYFFISTFLKEHIKHHIYLLEQ
jgi:S-formylglutathione hydrolase